MKNTLGSCYDGVIQYFADDSCTDFIGTGSLYVTYTCSPSNNYNYVGENAYQSLRCITSPKPVFPSYNYVAEE